MPTQQRGPTVAPGDHYAAWVARAGPVARRVEQGRHQLLRLAGRLAGEIGLPCPWSEVPRSNTDRGEMAALLREPGCPICRHVAETSARSFFWFLMEGYGEGAWVDRLVRAGGFCPRHMWQLADAGLAYRISYVVQYLSQYLSRRLAAIRVLLRQGNGHQAASLLRALARTEPCPMCASIEGSLHSLVKKLVRCLDQDALADVYAASDGLCWPHFQLAAELAEAAVLRLLVEVQLARTHQTQAQLSTESSAATKSTSLEQATTLVSGWRFQPHRGREHGQWVEL